MIRNVDVPEHAMIRQHHILWTYLTCSRVGKDGMHRLLVDLPGICFEAPVGGSHEPC